MLQQASIELRRKKSRCRHPNTARHSDHRLHTATLDGVIDLRDLIYFGSLIGLALFINVIIVDQKRAG